MAHTLPDSYSRLLDAKLRDTLVTKDQLIFAGGYEGDAKGGRVRIPVRSTEVAARDYDKTTGLSLEKGTTSYVDLVLDKDKAVNEIIDGYDAASVPDGIVAERLDSAAYSLGLAIDLDSVAALESGGTVLSGTTALTESTVYKQFTALRRQLTRNSVPNDGKRWALVSPETYELLLNDTTHFVRASDLSQELVESGVVGKIAGFLVCECNSMALDKIGVVTGKKVTTEIIVGHPEWCRRVTAWEVPVHIVNLTNQYIGSSAVQGRKIYGAKVTNAKAVLIKRSETAVSG